MIWNKEILNRIESFYISKYNLPVAAAQSIAAFSKAEVDLFYDAFKELAESSPKLEKLIESSRERIVLPFATAVEFYEKKLPLEKQSLKNERSALAKILSFLDQNPQYKNAGEFSKEFSSILDSWEIVLTEAEEKIPEFIKFCAKLLDRIKEKGLQRLIVTDRDYEMENLEARNEIYRKVLTKNSSWLLGFDLKALIKLSIQNANYNEFLVKLYNSDPKIKERALGEAIPVVFPAPLGLDKVKASELYENILPNQVSSQELMKLEKAICEYFDKRAEQIFE